MFSYSIVEGLGAEHHAEFEKLMLGVSAGHYDEIRLELLRRRHARRDRLAHFFRSHLGRARIERMDVVVAPKVAR